MAKSILKTVAMATGVSTLLFVGFSNQTFAMSPFQASYQFNYNGKNMGSATRTLSKSGNNWNYVFAASAYAAKDFLNVSYDPTREFYQEYNQAFGQYWKSKTGKEVNFKQSKLIVLFSSQYLII